MSAEPLLYDPAPADAGRNDVADGAEASRLVSEHMALIEAVGDPTLTVGLAVVPIAVKLSTGRWPRCRGGRGPSSTRPTANPPKGPRERRYRIAVGGRVGGARHRPMSAWPSRVARRLRSGRRHGPAGLAVIGSSVVIIFAYGHAIANGVLAGRRRGPRDIDEALRVTGGIRVRMPRWAGPVDDEVSRLCIADSRQSVSVDWRCWPRFATCACDGGSLVLASSVESTPHGRGQVRTATARYRHCVEQSTTCSFRTACVWALQPPYS